LQSLKNFKMKIKTAAAVLMVAGMSGMCSAGESPEVTIHFVQTEHPSSFPPLLWVQVRNPSYIPLELATQVSSSTLVVDGKSFPRTEPIFQGPPGLPAQGRWEGCLPLADYADPIISGKHRVSLKIGEAQSNEERISWSDPINWRQGNMKSREKEIRDMAAALKQGVPRSCVEQWLTDKDGGAQESRRVCYFLEPLFKVDVPYSQAGSEGRQDEVVDGPAKVYLESRVY
jgi:hypothetical protein